MKRLGLIALSLMLWPGAAFAFDPPIASYTINGNTYTNADWEANLQGALGGTAADISAVAILVQSLAPLITAVAFPGSFGATPTNIAELNIGGYPSGNEIPAGVLQGFTVKLDVPTTYTDAPWPNTAYSCYLRNRNSTVAGGSAVCAFGIVSAAVDNASGWLHNGVLTNVWPIVFDSTGNGLGNDFGMLVGVEYDYNIYKNGAAQPLGMPLGVRVIGGGEEGVAPQYSSMGYSLYPLALNTPWIWGFRTETSGAQIGIDLGALLLGASQASQPIYLRYTDADEVGGVGFFQMSALGEMTVGAVSFVAPIISSNTTYQIAGANIISRDAGNGQIIYNKYDGAAALILETAESLYDNTIHKFRSGLGAVDFLSIDNVGIFPASAAIPTNTTGPFFYIHSTAGTPTGIPTMTSAGRSAIVIDTAGHKFCWREQPTAVWYCAQGS